MAAVNVLDEHHLGFGSSKHLVRYRISNATDPVEMRRWHEVVDWLKADDCGQSGVYHIGFDEEAMIFRFSDPDTAFWFKMRWC